MSELPPKPSMAHYAKEALRQLLSKGEWSGRLPGERTLALRIGVSRPTLHQALLELEADGIVARRLKSAWRIIVENPKSLTGKRLVVFISPISLEDLDHFTLHQYTVLTSHLAERGFETKAVRLSSVRTGRAERALKDIAAQLRPSAWILHRCNATTQQWFSQSGLAAVVMGSTPPKIRIRSVDVDYRAAARHAVNQLLRLGHAADRIAYLMPDEKLLGHAEAAAGVEEATARSQGKARVLPTKDTTAATCEEIKRLWGEPRRPTALILHRPLQSISVLGQLLRLGARLPEDVSLIVLDDNPMLAHVVPHPTRYHKDTNQFATQLRKAIEHATGRSTKGAWSTRIVPELIAGETLAAPPRE